MKITISNAAKEPIYFQIYHQLKGEIISGALKEGDLLPSIRALAKDLRISVITTKRAYDELEKEGFIYSVAGKGSYVAEPDIKRIRETYLQQIEGHLEEIHALSKVCDLSKEDVWSMLNLIWDEKT